MKNKHIIISGIALFLITILLLGLTYAYYKTKVIGNTNEKTISSVGKKLEITYTDGNGVIEPTGKIEPGYTSTKTFSVKNTGDDTATYSIKLDNITNTFTRTEDWTYVLKEENTEINKGTIPTYETALLDSIEIESGVTKSYSLTVTYANLTDVDQSIDMGSTLSIRVNIADAVINSVTFIGNGNALENYRIYGNSIQRGMPTPDNPVEIESVGDKTKNLIIYPYEYIKKGQTKTVNGITYTDNGDGTITVNGTATSDVALRLSKFTAKKGVEYFLSGCPEGGSKTTYYLHLRGFELDIGKGAKVALGVQDDFTNDFEIVIMKGTNVNNLVFKPQLELGTTATEYEPYGYKIPVTVSGKNLFNINDYPKLTNCNNEDATSSLNIKDGYIYQSYDLCACSAYLTAKESWELSAGTYILSGRIQNTSDKNVYVGIRWDDDSRTVDLVTIESDSEGKKFYFSFDVNENKRVKGIYLMNSGPTSKSTISFSKVQLERGTTVTEYEPYVEPVTTNIYLDEPLRKVGDSADYIDFKEQKVVRNVATYEHKENTTATKGTEPKENMIYRNYFYPKIQMKKGINSDGFCTTLDTNARLWDDLMAPSVRFGQTNSVIYIVTPNSMATNQDLYNYVTNNGQNKCIYYYQAAESMQNSQIIPVITSLNGETNITVNTSLNPSYIEVK